MTLHTAWPWAGLILAPVLLGFLFFGRRRARWQDLDWLAWLLLPVYMLHQFEEHGIDALGQPYAFRASMCGVLGFLDPAGCPIPEAFLTAVNLGVVWTGGLIAALAGRRWPMLIAATYGVVVVNGVTHVLPAIVQQRYNPGVFTAAILFFPLGFWVLRTVLRDPDLGRPGAVRLIVAGALVHAVLMGSLVLFVRGVLSPAVLIAVNILNAGIPAALALVGASRSRRSGPPY